MRSYIIFSSILENTGSSDIGLQDAVWYGPLSGLGNILICASFHGLGKYWILSIALNIIVISLIAFDGRFFKILPLIRSIPGTLLFFVLSIMFLISCAVVLGMVYCLSVEVLVVCASV